MPTTKPPKRLYVDVASVENWDGAISAEAFKSPLTAVELGVRREDLVEYSRVDVPKKRARKR